MSRYNDDRVTNISTRRANGSPGCDPRSDNIWLLFEQLLKLREGKILDLFPHVSFNGINHVRKFVAQALVWGLPPDDLLR